MRQTSSWGLVDWRVGGAVALMRQRKYSTSCFYNCHHTWKRQFVTCGLGSGFVSLVPVFCPSNRESINNLCQGRHLDLEELLGVVTMVILVNSDLWYEIGPFEWQQKMIMFDWPKIHKLTLCLGCTILNTLCTSTSSGVRAPKTRRNTWRSEYGVPFDLTLFEGSQCGRVQYASDYHGSHEALA